MDELLTPKSFSKKITLQKFNQMAARLEEVSDDLSNDFYGVFIPLFQCSICSKQETTFEAFVNHVRIHLKCAPKSPISSNGNHLMNQSIEAPMGDMKPQVFLQQFKRIQNDTIEQFKNFTSAKVQATGIFARHEDEENANPKDRCLKALVNIPQNQKSQQIQISNAFTTSVNDEFNQDLEDENDSESNNSTLTVIHNLIEEKVESMQITYQDAEDMKNERTLSNQNKAATTIQAWYRGNRERRLLSSAITIRMKQARQIVRDAPHVDDNPVEDRALPLNKRINRYLSELHSGDLTDIKIAAIRLARLARKYHVAIEYMLSEKNIFVRVIKCLNRSNRSIPYSLISKPLFELQTTLLKYKPFVDEYVILQMNELAHTAVHQIYIFNKDVEFVDYNVRILELLSSYPTFESTITSYPDSKKYSFYMKQFSELFSRLPPTDHRSIAYEKLRQMFRNCNIEMALPSTPYPDSRNANFFTPSRASVPRYPSSSFR